MDEQEQDLMNRMTTTIDELVAKVRELKKEIEQFKLQESMHIMQDGVKVGEITKLNLEISRLKFEKEELLKLATNWLSRS